MNDRNILNSNNIIFVFDELIPNQP